MINQHRFVKPRGEQKINCNHHHLADVESLDIERKKNNKNTRKKKVTWKIIFFPLLSFSIVRSLFTSKRKRKKKSSSPHERRQNEAAHNISTPENLHYFSFKFKVCSAVWVSMIFFICFESFSPFSPRSPTCGAVLGLRSKSRFQYEIMTDHLLLVRFPRRWITAVCVWLVWDICEKRFYASFFGSESNFFLFSLAKIHLCLPPIHMAIKVIT